MIPEKIKKALIKNWGDKAEAMDCYCEIKFIEPNSGWACYVYAMDPNDEDSIKCISHFREPKIMDWSLIEVMGCYNDHGEIVIIDSEYRRMRVDELYKKLRGF